jgi:hypothetical protein
VIANKPPVIQRAPAVGANNNNTTNNVPNVSQLKPIRPLVRTTPDNPNPNATPAPPVSPRSVALRKSEQIPLRSTPDPIPSPAIQDEPQVEKATVLFDYAATSETEISFATGDVIIIIEKNDSGWWKGKIDDSTEGWFPSDFVELLGEKEPSIEERLAEVGSKEPRLVRSPLPTTLPLPLLITHFVFLYYIIIIRFYFSKIIFPMEGEMIIIITTMITFLSSPLT